MDWCRICCSIHGSKIGVPTYLRPLGHLGHLGHHRGFVSIYPQGLDDALPGGADLGTGWNVGTAGWER